MKKYTTILTQLQKQPMVVGLLTVLLTVILGAAIAATAGLTTPSQIMAQAVDGSSTTITSTAEIVADQSLVLEAAVLAATTTQVPTCTLIASPPGTINISELDYTNNGTVDIADVQFLLEVAVGSRSCPVGKICDLNGINNVTASDALMLDTYVKDPSKFGALTFEWHTTGATAFSIDHSIGSLIPIAIGTKAVTQPTVTTTYTATATGPGGTGHCSVTITVAATPNPTCTLTDKRFVAPSGALMTTLAWTTQNAQRFSINHDLGSRTPTAAGSITIPTTATTTYIGTAWAANDVIGIASSCNAVMTPPEPPVTPPPACTLRAIERADLDYNNDGAITSVDADFLLRVAVGTASCPAGKVCDVNGINNVTADDARMVLKFSTEATRSEKWFLAWRATNANDFDINQGVGDQGASGTGLYGVSPTVTTTYTGTATGLGGSTTCSVTIVVPTTTPAPTCTLIASPPGTINTSELDYNNDNTVNTADVQYLLEVAVGSRSCPVNKICDLNGSGSVLASDALMLDTYVKDPSKFGALTFQWRTTNATAFSIDHNIGALIPIAIGTKAVTPPTVTTTYTGTATGKGGTARCTVTVTVAPPPPPVPTCTLVVSPTSIQNGTSATLTWTTANATSFSIDQGVGLVTPTSAGTKSVSPTVTKTYTGTATGNGGVARCSAAITVTQVPPPPNAPTCTLVASPTSITKGQASILWWTTTNASSFSIDHSVGIVTPTQAGSKSVLPTVTTTYTATATGNGGVTHCSAVVTVTEVPPPTARPDLVAHSITTKFAFNGVPKNVDFLVGNLGAATTQAFTNRVKASRNSNGTGSFDLTSVMSGIPSTPRTTPSSVGPHTFMYDPTRSTYSIWGAAFFMQLCVDTAGVVTESREDNNCTTWDGLESGDDGSIWDGVVPGSYIKKEVLFVLGPEVTAGSVSPTTATVGTPVQLSAAISNAGSQNTAARFENKFQLATNAQGAGATNIGTHTQTSLIREWEDALNWVPTAPYPTATATTSYTFGSAGTYYVRACADSNSSFAELIEFNNCGPWTQIVVTTTPSAPMCTLTASPSAITSGGSTSLAWTTAHASAFSIDQGIGATTTSASSLTLAPTVTTTYTGTVTSAVGTARCTATVTVTTPPPAPTCTLTAQPSSVESGARSSLSWTTTNATAFSINGGIGSLSPVGAGSTTTPAVTGNTTFTGTATSASGQTVTCSAPVTVIVREGNPSCSLTVSPTPYITGGSATLTWSGSRISSVDIDNGIATATSSSGSILVSPAAVGTYTYIGTFHATNGQTLKCNATLQVTSAPVTGCTSNCGGGGGGGGGSSYTPPRPNVLLSSTPHAGTVAGAYVYLSQMPYTGLDLGVMGTVFYWLALIGWSLALVYLVLFNAFPFAHRSIQTFGGRVSIALNARELAPATQTHSATVIRSEQIAPRASQEAPQGYSSFDGFKSFAHNEVLSIEDIVKGLTRAHKIAPAPMTEPIYENVEPIQNVITSVQQHDIRPSITEHVAEVSGVATDVRGFTNALIQGDREAVFAGLRQHTRGGGSPETLLSPVVCLLDDVYRARVDGTTCDPDIARLTARLTTPALENLVAALTTAIDSSYSTGATGAKLALTRALSTLGA